LQTVAKQAIVKKGWITISLKNSFTSNSIDCFFVQGWT